MWARSKSRRPGTARGGCPGKMQAPRPSPCPLLCMLNRKCRQKDVSLGRAYLGLCPARERSVTHVSRYNCISGTRPSSRDHTSAPSVKRCNSRSAMIQSRAAWELLQPQQRLPFAAAQRSSTSGLLDNPKPQEPRPVCCMAGQHTTWPQHSTAQRSSVQHRSMDTKNQFRKIVMIIMILMVYQLLQPAATLCMR